MVTRDGVTSSFMVLIQEHLMMFIPDETSSVGLEASRLNSTETFHGPESQKSDFTSCSSTAFTQSIFLLLPSSNLKLETLDETLVSSQSIQTPEVPLNVTTRQ